MKQSNWVSLLMILFFSLVGTMYLFVTAKDLKMPSLHLFWFLTSLVFVVLWWTLDAVSIWIIFKASHVIIPYKLALMCMLVGFFFGAITPFNSGTIPAILLFLQSKNIPIQKSLAPVMMKTMLNGIARAIMSIFLALYLRNIVSNRIGDILRLILTSYGLILILAYFILMNTSSLANKTRKYLFHLLFWIGRKFSILFTVASTLAESIVESPERLKPLTKKLYWLPSCLFFIFLFWLCQLTLPSTILLAMKLKTNFIAMAVTQASFYLLQPYLPTPGGSGMAEVGFGFLSKNINGITSPVFVLLWRSISFYLPVSVGAFFFIHNLQKRKYS